MFEAYYIPNLFHQILWGFCHSLISGKILYIVLIQDGIRKLSEYQGELYGNFPYLPDKMGEYTEKVWILSEKGCYVETF
jgi:hypothetical protein